MASNPRDPNRIDVALEVVGTEGRDAIASLAAQVSKLTEHLATAGSMDPATIAGSAGAAHRQGHAGVRDMGPAASHSARIAPTVDDAGVNASNSWSPEEEYASRPVRPNGPSVNASSPPPINPDAELLAEGNMGPWRRTRRYLSSGGRLRPGQILSRELDVYGARERAQVAARQNLGGGDYDLPGIHAPQEIGGSPSGSASVPPINPTEPRSRYNLRSDPLAWARGEESASIPQFGEMTIQDKLKIGAGFLQRSAERAYQGSQEVDRSMSADEAYNQVFSGAGNKRYMASGLMRQGADMAGKLYPVVQDFRRVGGFFGGMNSTGVSAGFEQRTIEKGPFGMFDPTSPAVMEGARQKWTAARLRMKGGINGEQAAGIVNGLAANGFVGSEGQDLAFDAVAPLVQQGLNPEITANQFSEAIRNGATPMKEFRETLDQLGPAARAARMSLDEYQESLGGFADQMQEMGATYGQGYQLGKNLSSSYGMAPQQINTALQSPITQGMALRQGYLPTTMGNMGSGEAATSINQSVQLAWDASNFFTKPIVDEKTGHVTTVEDQRMSQAASTLGMTKDEYEKFYRRGKISAAGATAREALDSYTDARKKFKKEIDPSKTSAENLIQVSKDTPGAEKIGDHWYINHNTPGNRDKLKQLDAQSGGGLSSWTTTQERLRDVVRAGETPEERTKMKEALSEVSKTKDPEKRMKEATKFLDKYAKENLPNDGTPTVVVKFTGKAEQFFKVDEKGTAETIARGGANAANAIKNGPAGVAAEALNIVKGFG